MRNASRSPSAALTVIAAAALTACFGSPFLAGRAARAQEEIGIESAFHAKAHGPTWECLAGDAFYWESVPPNVREREKVEKTARASNEVAKVEGEFKLDYEMPDFTGLSEKKPPAVTCRFARKDGSKWALRPAPDAAVERGALGSSGKEFAFGLTGKGTPLEPKQRVGFRLRGKARLEKDGKVVAQDAPFSLVVGSKTRDPETGKYMGGFETIHDGLEAKLVVPDSYDVPEGGGKGITVVFTRVTASK